MSILKCVVPDIPVFATRQYSPTKRKSSEFEYRVTVFAGDESNDFQIFVSENERMSWLPRMGDNNMDHTGEESEQRSVLDDENDIDGEKFRQGHCFQKSYGRQ